MFIGFIGVMPLYMLTSAAVKHIRAYARIVNLLPENQALINIRYRMYDFYSFMLDLTAILSTSKQC